MNPSNPWQRYRQVATQTATPSQLVLMLYDGAIRFLEQARAGFALEDPLEFNQTIHNNVTRAQDILTELNSSLDKEQGGEFAERMSGLYNYLDRRLHESNMAKTEAGLVEAISRITVLRDAWSEAFGKAGASAADSSSGSPLPAAYASSHAGAAQVCELA